MTCYHNLPSNSFIKVLKIYFLRRSISSTVGVTVKMDKTLGTNFTFHVKERTKAKVQYLLLSTFSPVLTKFSVWKGDWALGYNPPVVLRFT